MSLATLRPEERTGLLVALLLHAVMIAALLIQPRRDAAVPVPDRMVVSLADEVALEATGPVLSSDSLAAEAPALSEEIGPAEQVPEQARPAPDAAVDAPPAPTPRRPREPVQRAGGASRIGSDFLDGAASGSRDANAPVPASQIGAAEKASLAQAIARQLKPHWSSPQGADAELLVTVLAFDLAPDGSLRGPPRVVEQTGITDANRPQAGRHAELAVRAVQLASPFDLPSEYYNAWKRVSAFRFDRKLSQ